MQPISEPDWEYEFVYGLRPELVKDGLQGWEASGYVVHSFGQDTRDGTFWALLQKVHFLEAVVGQLTPADEAKLLDTDPRSE